VGEDSGPVVRVAWCGGRWHREENVQSHDANRRKGGGGEGSTDPIQKRVKGRSAGKKEQWHE
jgi:hypothetical protein